MFKKLMWTSYSFRKVLDCWLLKNCIFTFFVGTFYSIILEYIAYSCFGTCTIPPEYSRFVLGIHRIVSFSSCYDVSSPVQDLELSTRLPLIRTRSSERNVLSSWRTLSWLYNRYNSSRSLIYGGYRIIFILSAVSSHLPNFTIKASVLLSAIMTNQDLVLIIENIVHLRDVVFLQFF